MNQSLEQFDLSIVLPTFNESKNVGPIVTEIEEAFALTDFKYEIIFVDDSNDHTPDCIRHLQSTRPCVRLIHRAPEERTGLGTAILAGMYAAQSPIVCSMDSDLQHPPATIVPMYNALQAQKKNFVVASRMMEGGSAEGLANSYRHFVSRAARLLSWVILPLTKKTTDPMTGFFMLKTEILDGAELNPIGFKLLIEMLARIPAINNVDVSFVMRKREFDESKASFKEGMRYFRHLAVLAVETPYHSILRYIARPFSAVQKVLNAGLLLACLGAVVVLIASFVGGAVATVLVCISLFLIIQLLYTLYILTYAWDHPGRIHKNASPKQFLPAQKSFTAVIPALNEAEVIPYTIRAVANIDYPENLKETLVVLRDTDYATIEAAEKTIREIGKKNIKLSFITGEPYNKPHHLNVALKHATGDVICIFDAEDEPHKEIYDVVNTVMLRDGADVVQSGVQLMNFESNWYSLFNVLEYFLWFGSALHYYEKQGVIPLGGNTVFFDTKMVRDNDGWDWFGLTEDAEIGIRLSTKGAKIRVVYDPIHATQEETPPTLMSFIKQRTRWSQGFLQILAKPKPAEYYEELTLRQRALIWYILGWPMVHALLFLYIPISLLVGLFIKVHPVVTLISMTPLLLLGVFLAVQNIALYEFTKIYKKKWSPMLILKTIVYFVPYQMVLSYSSFRAVIRQLQQQTAWEKTEHINAHRVQTEVVS